MRILYVATVGGFMPFFKTLVRELLDEGHIVDFAANQSASKVPDYYKEWGCKVFDISCSRSPFNFGNIRAIKEIRNLAMNYDIVHCHTPLAGMATRLACKKLRKKQELKVIYTAHGFHFYQGAPKKNWLIYFPIEKMCSKWTDILITINREDYNFAKKRMKAKRIEYIPGVGIDISSFSNVSVNKREKKLSLGLSESNTVLLSIGELNTNKNHQIVIKAISKLNDSNIHYLIAGQGSERDNLITLADSLGVNLHLLGYRNDIKELLKIADLYVLPSIREGLNVSLMEALASNCPTIASRIRGNVDMIPDQNCFSPSNEEEICALIKRGALINKFDLTNIDSASINRRIIEIYKDHEQQ